MRRRLICVATALLLWSAAPALAEPGDLDPGFSSDGRVTALDGGGFVARAVAVQPDRKIVVGGYACTPSDPEDGTCRASGASSFRMLRYTARGTLDPGFGTRGVVTTAVGIRRSQAFDVVVERDGRIVLAGVARDGGGRDGFALARYTSRGALDPSFGERGVVIASVGSGFSGIADLASAPGGDLVASGVAQEAGATRFALARYHSDGTRDARFGRGGTVLGGAAPFNQALATAVAPAGQVLAAGISGSSQDLAAARFGLLQLDADGAPDPGFGSGGGLVLPVGSSAAFANALAVLRDGRVLAAGSATDPQGRQVMGFARVTADGRPDSTWDGDGASLVRVGQGALAADVMRDGQERVVAFGQSASGRAGWHFAVTRLAADGVLDGTFGTGGVVVTGFPGTTTARATAGALAPDGRLVAAGVGCVGGRGAQCAGGSPRLTLARYLGGGAVARPPTQPRPPVTVQSAPFVVVSFPRNPPVRPFRVRIRVACLQATPCRGTLQVRTRRAYRPLRRPGGRPRPRRRLAIAVGAVRVPAGRSRDVTLLLFPTGRVLARALAGVPVRVSVRAPGPAGATREVSREGTLRGR